MLAIPKNSVGLRLARIDLKERLILCEPVRFASGFNGVETTLRRAAISGLVNVGGKIIDHFADVLYDNGDIIETVSLDRYSYSALKNHWMRCKVDHSDEINT
jgi:hypothetical protein